MRAEHGRTVYQGKHTWLNLSKPVSLLIYDENICVTDANNHMQSVGREYIRTCRYVMATFGGGFLKRLEGITIDRAGFVFVISGHSWCA